MFVLEKESNSVCKCLSRGMDERERERGRGRERKRIPNRLCTVSTEPDTGSIPQTVRS